MSYTLRPLASGDTLVSSRDPIRTNFTLLQSRFNENHVDIDGGSGGGKHKFLQLPEQAAGPTVAVNEAGFYAKVSGVTPATSALFFRGESSGSEYQMTTASDGNIATFGANPGWTFLPGGLIMQYGTIAATAATGTETFSFTFPNAIFQVVISVESTTANRTVATHTFTTANFKWLSGNVGGVQNFHWYAIGN